MQSGITKIVIIDNKTGKFNIYPNSPSNFHYRILAAKYKHNVSNLINRLVSLNFSFSYKDESNTYLISNEIDLYDNKKINENNKYFKPTKLKEFQKVNKDNLIKDNLIDKFWSANLEFNEDIRERLMAIAEDFHDSLEVDSELVDVYLVGSIANYNWHPLSDLDVHLVVDFSKIDENTELVEEWLKGKKKMWNNLHNIEINGHDVELSVENINHQTISSGKFSLMNNEWVTKPTKEIEPNENKNEALKIVKKLSKKITNLELDFQMKEKEPYKIYEESKKIWKLVKNLRSGLKEHGEFDSGNIAFKELRNKGYIEKIVKIKNRTYDEIFSI